VPGLCSKTPTRRLSISLLVLSLLSENEKLLAIPFLIWLDIGNKNDPHSIQNSRAVVITPMVTIDWKNSFLFHRIMALAGKRIPAGFSNQY
jgi:hypothetical protein